MALLSLTDDSAITEPVSLDVAKEHLRVDFSDEDPLIDAAIVAARQYYEEETGRQLVRVTYALTLDCFPRSRYEAIRLPRPPLVSITSIEYVDTAGATQTWASSEYTVETFAGPMARSGRVYPAPDYTWPDTRRIPGAVTITYEAGYADGSVPGVDVAVLLKLIENEYSMRGGQVTGTIVSDDKMFQRMLNRRRLPAYA